MCMHPILLNGARIRAEYFGGILMAPISSALKTGQAFYLLTEVEYLALKHCNGINDVESIAKIIVNEFDAELQQVIDDIANYFTEMVEIGILGKKEGIYE